jgi:hypothetical protein
MFNRLKDSLLNLVFQASFPNYNHKGQLLRVPRISPDNRRSTIGIPRIRREGEKSFSGILLKQVEVSPFIPRILPHSTIAICRSSVLIWSST